MKGKMKREHKHMDNGLDALNIEHQCISLFLFVCVLVRVCVYECTCMYVCACAYNVYFTDILTTLTTYSRVQDLGCVHEPHRSFPEIILKVKLGKWYPRNACRNVL